MQCDQVRGAISAQIDGEDPGLPPRAVAGHLAGCAACRGWRQRAHIVTRRARLSGYPLDRDLSPGVRAALPTDNPPGGARPGTGRPAASARMRLAGFVILLAAIFAVAHGAGAHFGPLTPGHGPVQFRVDTSGTVPGPGGTDSGGTDSGGMDMSGNP